MRLHRFHGGLRLAGHKTESTAQAIRRCALPERLAVPLSQIHGDAAVACVAPGQRVRCGELIGVAEHPRSVPVHAPAAGSIVAIESRSSPIAANAPEGVVVIACDGSDDRIVLPPLHAWQSADAETLVARIRDAGIVGLGGAAFPTAEKLAHARRTVILNGAECEPYIACDDRLLRERAADVVRGGRVLRRAVGAERVLLAIEDRMPEARQAAIEAIALHGDGEIELVSVPTIYPEGGERQLIRVLTGLEVPSGGLPRDIGIVVHNVGTAAACWRAVAQGEALLARIVTVTGPGVVQPGNYEVAIGTPIAHLIAQAGGYTTAAQRLVIGGPMMGIALPHDDFPITAASNCVLVLAAGQVRDSAPELPCIRCGECSRVCPAQLLPQQLHTFLRATDMDRALSHGLFDCIECGCCDLVCPSHIPLVEQFRVGKTRQRVHEFESAAATAARERYDSRRARLARDDAERAEQQAARGASASAAVQAALERARARKSDGQA